MNTFEQYVKAIEIYLGRVYDPMVDAILYDDGDTYDNAGVITKPSKIYIGEWNITDKPKPTMEQLEAFADQANVSLDLDLKIEKVKMIQYRLSDRDVNFDKWRRKLIKIRKAYEATKETLLGGT